MRIIAVANQKGGCGKTTVAINLSACLANQGRRTLLVDMDPQSHCAVGLAVPEEQIHQSIYNVLCGEQRVDLAIVTWQISKDLDLAPSCPGLQRMEQELATAQDRLHRLAEALHAVADDYDYCVVDCPPSIGLLTGNALRAAGEVIIPVDTGYFALHGLTRQMTTMAEIVEETGQDLDAHILPNLYDVRTKHARQVIAELRKKFGGQVLKTHINFNAKLREATGYGQPICDYDPSSPGHRDFNRLASEIISVGEIDTVHHVLLEQASALARRADELLATSSPLLGPSEEPTSEPTPEEVDKKIETTYGVQPTDDGVRFAVHAPGASHVELAGDFNNWSPESTALAHEDDNGSFGITLRLDPGRYRYRYVIDGAWTQDPHNTYVESNPYGELNSIVEVDLHDQPEPAMS